jgi:error-prone DNA polymerase
MIEVSVPAVAPPHDVQIGLRTTPHWANASAQHGRIQREGEVVHLVAHKLTDLSPDLASVGDREAAFPLPHGRGDEFHHGSPGIDPRNLPPKGLKTRDIYIPDLHIDTIKVKARDFR